MYNNVWTGSDLKYTSDPVFFTPIFRTHTIKSPEPKMDRIR